MTVQWSIVQGGPIAGRVLRYAITLCIGWAIILAMAVAVFVLTPKTYDSGFTLILPGAGANASVNLESMGQANSSASSPFGGHGLSPTENYKRLFQSYKVRGRVAEELNLTMAEVSPPQVKLVNQTKFMYVSVRASSPEAAQQLAETWLNAFEAELAILRNEEQDLREQAYRDTLASFEGSVRDSQAKIIAFQSKHGLISVEQFQELVAKTEILRFELERARAEQSVVASEVDRLSRLLGLSADQAADVLTLLSDNSFQALMEALSVADKERAELSEMFGPNHPQLVAVKKEYAGINAGLFERGELLLGFERFVRLDRIYYTSSKERSVLIAALVEASVKLSGVQERRRSMADQLENTLRRVDDLAIPATELDALLRDHQVAETVFASALARIDTSRTDIFASYPLTQIVELPGLPETAATPSKKFIALGTFAGLLFYSIGLALLWLRLPIIRALLKTL